MAHYLTRQSLVGICVIEAGNLRTPCGAWGSYAPVDSDQVWSQPSVPGDECRPGDPKRVARFGQKMSQLDPHVAWLCTSQSTSWLYWLERIPDQAQVSLFVPLRCHLPWRLHETNLQVLTTVIMSNYFQTIKKFFQKVLSMASKRSTLLVHMRRLKWKRVRSTRSST